jgi:non-specific serine/threonine protein kinase
MNLSRVGDQVRALREQLSRTAPRDTAAGPGGPAGNQAILRRVGDVWTVQCRGRTLHLTDGRGVRLLALLLERPDTEVHSLDLVAAVEGSAPIGPAIEHSGGQETGGRFGVQGSAGPALDEQAKDDYRARIDKLEAHLAQAEARRDEAGVKRLGGELEFVRGELARALGKGGRDRESGSHAERARINVTRAIRATLKKIEGYDEQLGAELGRCVRTGAFCSYAPDPARPLRWTVRR